MMTLVRELAAPPRCQTQHAALLWVAIVATACTSNPATSDNADAAVVGSADSAPPNTPDGECAEGPDGVPCVFTAWDDAVGACDPTAVNRVLGALTTRRGELPIWHDGRALFGSFGQPTYIAGEFNDWDSAALGTAALCGSDTYTAMAEIPSGSHRYKIITNGTWSLDPENRRFSFDSFAGNPDGRNSVVNTYDSGRGHLEQPAEQLCSDALGNCRWLTAYVPPGYATPGTGDRQYPVIFMHDGQNLFDDEDCCFGHTGWEINRTLDVEITAGTVAPAVIVGIDHGGERRGAEYAFAAADGGVRETFMEFVVNTVRPEAATLWRVDLDQASTAGSSFGGVISFALALTYPEAFQSAASLSGSFWVGRESGTSIADLARGFDGATPLPLYVDHGGTASDEADNYRANLGLLDTLADLGWTRGTAPACQDATLCYHHAVGAEHNELAWRDRGHQFLRFLVPGFATSPPPGAAP